jgi:hypothetical protein
MFSLPCLTLIKSYLDVPVLFLGLAGCEMVVLEASMLLGSSCLFKPGVADF